MSQVGMGTWDENWEEAKGTSSKFKDTEDENKNVGFQNMIIMSKVREFNDMDPEAPTIESTILLELVVIEFLNVARQLMGQE